MLDIDRWPLGWGPQLTQRQTRIIAARLQGDDVLPEDEAHLPDLTEWFVGQAREFARAKGEET